MMFQLTKEDIMSLSRCKNFTLNKQNGRVFYCQPYSFTQKGACEKNHEEIRYILPKKTSIQFMTQTKAAIVMSHINSLARASLGGRTPYEKFVELYGEETLKKLGVQFIPAKDVNLTPSIIN